MPLLSAYRARSSQNRAQRSPYRGEASRRSINRAKASGAPSARNAATSSGVGGRPVRSKVTRRIKARLSAGGAGLSWFASRPARMKRSIGDLIQASSLTGGGAGVRTGRNAQYDFCSSPNRGPLDSGLTAPGDDVSGAGQGAPARTQSARAAMSPSGSFPFGGILRSSA